MTTGAPPIGTFFTKFQRCLLSCPQNKKNFLYCALPCARCAVTTSRSSSCSQSSPVARRRTLPACLAGRIPGETWRRGSVSQESDCNRNTCHSIHWDSCRRPSTAAERAHPRPPIGCHNSFLLPATSLRNLRERTAFGNRRPYCSWDPRPCRI